MEDATTEPSVRAKLDAMIEEWDAVEDFDDISVDDMLTDFVERMRTIATEDFA